MECATSIIDKYLWQSKLKNVFICKNRYATKVGTDVNKIYMHMLSYSTCLYHVYMPEDINLL